MNFRGSQAVVALIVFHVFGCQSGSPERPGLKQDLRSDDLPVPSAYIPPQCYTKTTDLEGKVHNPCFACHQASQQPNFINDDDLQLEYAFTETAVLNPYTNLFVDRTKEVDAISDDWIDEYVAVDNYRAKDGTIDIAKTLETVPALWDANGNGTWDGYVPDIELRFDAEGFDITEEGKPTGWRALAYAPFPGTFWPTNGSAGDVFIRLPEAFQTTIEGTESREAYRINLAIIEALIKRETIQIDATNEETWGVDLNKNGQLDQAEEVVFDWAPLKGKFMSYVGMAKVFQEQGALKLAAGLYPVGTEFLHTVRYLEAQKDGSVTLARRLKELRYSRKDSWRTYSQLQMAAHSEAREKEAFPDRLRAMAGSLEEGVKNGQGWTYAGFIEDSAGYLRPQTFQETTFCVGCHSGVGATDDSSFAFGRKFDHDSHAQGWYHWDQKSMAGAKEPMRADGRGEYRFYLTHNNTGNEYRTNDEVKAMLMTKDGKLRPDVFDLVQKDITSVIVPSAERARVLNKAYRVITNEQSFVHGRDATVHPVTTVHRKVETGTPTGIETALTGPWVSAAPK